MITKETKKEDIIKIAECKKDCKACQTACKHGSGSLTQDDIKNISEFLNITEGELKERYLQKIVKFNTQLWRPKFKQQPFGKCIFFKEGCKIHPVKPLECKVATCKPTGELTNIWFTLNHFINKEDPESIRQFALYLKLEGKTLEGGNLEDFVPNKKKLNNILNYKII